MVDICVTKKALMPLMLSELSGRIIWESFSLEPFMGISIIVSSHYCIEPYHDTERLEFAWDGEDEMDPVSGRGWAIIKDGQLQGRIYFHEGDDSGFTAQKEA
jgi:hypothetical protein